METDIRNLSIIVLLMLFQIQVIKNSAGLPFEGQAYGVPNSNIDLIMQRMVDMMQNQFGLKPKNQSYVYKSPYPEWYNRVALPPRVKPPTNLTKFSSQDDTSTIEHISRYLMQLVRHLRMKLGGFGIFCCP